MNLITEPDQWKGHHRLRHRVSTRTFNWLSRRNMIRHKPGVHFRVKHHAVRLHDLPASLDGITIAHLSDLHVGSVLRPERLGPIVDAINAAGADMIVNTGDVLDHSNRYLPPAVEALAKLAAPLGVYHVLGNHDYRDDGEAVREAFEAAGLDLLVNDHRAIEVNGCRIHVAGIDWAGHPVNIKRLVDHTMQAVGESDLRILLAHHPHALDPAVQHRVQLVLAGHTHGGQMVIRKNRGRRESIGLGNMKWRYAQGHYQRHGTHLHVTNGLGGSFPLRFRCPAEISVLELKAT